MPNLKPILEELKSLKESINSDSIRDLVLNNIQENRDKIESRIKNLADTTKNNPVVNEYLDQILKAELTNQAVDKLQNSFPEHELVKKIVEVRQSLIDPSAVESEESTSSEPTTTEAPSNSEKKEEVKLDSETKAEESVEAKAESEEKSSTQEAKEQTEEASSTEEKA